ncbi:MAG: hypothetical protein RRZ85_08355, partial [Gordonibacter sp.]|uniref:hypothetical protein n=1 Tax=Gordonibacter sp. TaxID=1968902 RepID=UPI002FC7C390
MLGHNPTSASPRAGRAAPEKAAKAPEAEQVKTSLGANDSLMAAESTIDIPFGQAYHLEGITQG